ncbi:TPA: transposase domain-containing protein [Klebsiella pneumoniae]
MSPINSRQYGAHLTLTSYLRYVLDVIADWPINRVSELLPWRVALPTE